MGGGAGGRARGVAGGVEWSGSIRWFRGNVKRLRPARRRIERADRLTWAAGDAAQCDWWFPPRKIPLEDGTTKLLPVLVITAAHSRLLAKYLSEDGTVRSHLHLRALKRRYI